MIEFVDLLRKENTSHSLMNEEIEALFSKRSSK